jgi:DNA ligase D-like protein (predicted 3'-phosphoesterase)
MAKHLRFVIQRHNARTVHYDFRLERSGVFKSWALPKGLPTKPGVRRLAIETVDHELAFGDFEGAIPEGEYGAGKIVVWDRGDYVEEQWSENAITVFLCGTIVSGRYQLVRFQRGGDRTWLLWKIRQ